MVHYQQGASLFLFASGLGELRLMFSVLYAGCVSSRILLCTLINTKKIPFANVLPSLVLVHFCKCRIRGYAVIVLPPAMAVSLRVLVVSRQRQNETKKNWFYYTLGLMYWQTWFSKLTPFARVAYFVHKLSNSKRRRRYPTHRIENRGRPIDDQPARVTKEFTISFFWRMTLSSLRRVLLNDTPNDQERGKFAATHFKSKLSLRFWVPQNKMNAYSFV